MSLITILIIVLILVALFGAPTWGYSRNWGYGWMPSGGIGLIVVILIVLLLLGVVPYR